MKGGNISRKKQKTKRYADVPMEEEGAKTTRKKKKTKMKRKRYRAEGRNTSKKMKMEAKRKSPIAEGEEEEGRRTYGKKKMKRKRYCAEARNTSRKKRKMKMEAKRKSPIEEEEEGRRTHGKKKKMMKRKRCYVDIPIEEEIEEERRRTSKKMKRERCCVDIPMDVLVDILSRLPARCVWRLRSVCKDWKSHIESPAFADLQLRRGSKEEEKPVFMFWARKKYNCKRDPYENTRFYSIDYRDGKAVRVIKQEFLHLTYSKASSINGLVCYHGSDGEIKVCNPVNRELFNLPKPTFLPNQPKNFPFDIGIGFDSTAKTYKVLAVPGSSTSEVEMFTLGATSVWKKIQLPSVKIFNIYSQGLYANGCLFWFTSDYFGGWGRKRDMSRALMTFNFAQEKFEFVPLPPDFDIDYCFHRICEVRGRVCLIEAKRLKGMVKMWTLAVHSGTQLWIAHHAVLPRFADIISVSVLFPIPNGVMLFKKSNYRRYICSYNEQGQVVKSTKVDGISRRFCPIQLHTESLVSLRSILAPNL